MAERVAHLNIQTHDNADQRPSVFDVLAQETLMSGLKPAARFALKICSSMYPHLFRPVYRHFDEWYAGFELLLQNYYLKHYSASFAENFYGLKRVAIVGGQNLSTSLRFRSLFFLIAAPYLKSKLDVFYEKIKEKQTRMILFKGRRRKMMDIFVMIYPKICAAFEFWTLLLQIGYLISKSNVHSPWLVMAGVRLVNLLPDEMFKMGPNANNSATKSTFLHTIGSFWNKFFGWICKMLGLGLYFVQFLDWMSTSGEKDKISLARLPVPNAPHELLAENSVVKMDPQLCPLCGSKRKNDTVLAISGYVFCYTCIFNHIQRRKCCPVTKIPAGTEHLIRLYIQTTPLI